MNLDKKIKIALTILTGLIVIIAITKHIDNASNGKHVEDESKNIVQTEISQPEQSADPLVNEKNKRVLAEINKSLTEGYKAKKVIEVDKDAQEVIYLSESGSTGVLEIWSLAKLDKQFWKDNYDIEVNDNINEKSNADEENYQSNDDVETSENNQE